LLLCGAADRSIVEREGYMEVQLTDEILAAVDRAESSLLRGEGRRIFTREESVQFAESIQATRLGQTQRRRRPPLMRHPYPELKRECEKNILGYGWTRMHTDNNSFLYPYPWESASIRGLTFFSK
jgi:hypothetical protein